MSDIVRLTGVACRVRVGVPAAERRRRQRVLVDAALETDVRRAAARDDFREAVDYQAVERLLRAEAESGERALVETLAERLAAAVLRAQPRVAAATVRVRKTPAAMPGTREVSVEVRRTR
ncbi:MAG: dihydroneopterin aldolase [Elusimicrobia bacterium]|nr:dihydroneopterin aldolase [Elusimicrobiota bacterium]